MLASASSHGVLRALMSGMMAAHVIAQAVAGSAVEVVAIEAYVTWMRTWFQADADELRRLYRTLPNPPAWVRAPD